MYNENKDKMVEFAFQHMYYINQFFGDEGLRKIITELKPSEKWNLYVKSFPPDGDFEGSFHHILQSKDDKNEYWDSEEVGIQCYYNDTLCQSYSLMKYLGKIHPRQRNLTKKLQMGMIKMYKDLLKNKKIQKYIKKFSKRKDLPYPIKKKNQENILKIINKTLNDWGKFGWMYFMLDEMENSELYK